MKATVTGYPYFPTLVNSTGAQRTAPFNTYDKEKALQYAELAAKLSQHDDLDKIVWPGRSDPMDEPVNTMAPVFAGDDSGKDRFGG